MVSSYLLAETVATVLAGKFGDLFGRKLMLQVSAGLFILASAACGFATDMVWLIGARAVQGIGAGGLMVTATALIGDVIPLRDRGKYQGALGSVFGATTVLGPLLGGLFTDHLSWRWAFYINLPLGIAVIAIASLTLPQIARGTRPSIDYLGILFVGLGASMLTLAVSWGGTEYAWGSATIIGLFIASAVAFAIFVRVESRAASPILPLRLFRNRVFTVSVVLSFIVGFAMLGAMTYLPTYMQYVHGVSATSSGIRTLPMVIGLLVTSTVAGSIVGRTGRYKIFPVAGALIMALGLYLLSTMDADTSTLMMSLFLLVMGMGVGLSMQILTIIVQNTAAYEDLGVATSGVTFFRTMGSSFGASIMGTVYANELADRLPAALASAGVSADQVATPALLHRLADAQSAPIIGAYAETLQVVFLAAVPVAGLAFLLALFLEEVPLRDTSRAAATDPGDGFAMPNSSDSAMRLDAAVAQLLRRQPPETFTRLRESAVDLDAATAWCVRQIGIREWVGGERSLVAIGHRLGMPGEVLAPAFASAAAEGYLYGDEAGYALTEAGKEELAKLVAAFKAWLAAELADWGADDAKLDEALAVLSRKLVEGENDLKPTVAA
ncbi:MDR family MFS transporter [Nocardioides luteus]|uniref:MDR family MFS transporter n=1 Tax=Nocardioides luteus TaxID=1844 RepID=UPI00210B9005|nr:MDR family MFS transporter [Nocardioides luteus]